MKRLAKSADKSHGKTAHQPLAAMSCAVKFLPRVAKLDKNKYAAYVDLPLGYFWEMAQQEAPPVRICKKRKSAEKAALALVAMVRKQEGATRKRA